MDKTLHDADGPSHHTRVASLVRFLRRPKLLDRDWNSVICTGKKTPGGSVPVPVLTSAAARALRKYDDECL